MEYIYDRETGKRIQVPSSVAASMIRSDRYSRTKPNYNYDGAAAEVFGEKWAGPSGLGPIGELDFVTRESLERDYNPQPVFEWNYLAPKEYNTRGYDAGVLTVQERQQVEQLWNSMLDSPQQWWTQNPDGSYDTTTIGMQNIEGLGEQDERFSSKVIGMVQNLYRDINPNEVIDSGGEVPPFGYGGGGGYGGSARVDAAYLAPDRRVIEDMVKAQLITYTGEARDQDIQQLADVFMRDHKQQWVVQRSAAQGTGGMDVDPNASVMAAIREREDYKRIHKLRPEGADEARWISERRDALRQKGVSQGSADERAIVLAQSAANPLTLDPDAFQAGAGEANVGASNRLAEAASRMARLI